VNTDAHSALALAHAEIGVSQARRAWLTKDQILNTRSWRDVKRLAK
jgi:DNA polymerase (family X)